MLPVAQIYYKKFWAVYNDLSVYHFHVRHVESQLVASWSLHDNPRRHDLSNHAEVPWRDLEFSALKGSSPDSYQVPYLHPTFTVI